MEQLSKIHIFSARERYRSLIFPLHIFLTLVSEPLLVVLALLWKKKKIGPYVCCHAGLASTHFSGPHTPPWSDVCLPVLRAPPHCIVHSAHTVLWESDGTETK